MRYQNLPIYTILLILFLVAVIPEEASAQTRRGGRVYRFQNILEHDERPYHFGFSLGINSMDYHLLPISDLEHETGFTYVLSEMDRGFHIGIVSNLKLHQYFDLRFIPTFRFGDLLVEYYKGEFERNNPSPDYRQELSPYYLDFPLHIKYKSARMTNTRAYVIGGVKYSYDLSSFENKTEGDEPLYLRTRQHDLQYEFGVGFDHYFYYFKFSTEIKASFGLRNLALPGEQGSEYHNSIDSLNSRSIMISFLFE